VTDTNMRMPKERTTPIDKFFKFIANQIVKINPLFLNTDHPEFNQTDHASFFQSARQKGTV